MFLAAGPVAGQPHPRHPSADAALGTPPKRRHVRLSRQWRLRGGRGAPPGATRSRDPNDDLESRSCVQDRGSGFGIRG